MKYYIPTHFKIISLHTRYICVYRVWAVCYRVLCSTENSKTTQPILQHNWWWNWICQMSHKPTRQGGFRLEFGNERITRQLNQNVYSFFFVGRIMWVKSVKSYRMFLWRKKFNWNRHILCISESSFLKVLNDIFKSQNPISHRKFEEIVYYDIDRNNNYSIRLYCKNSSNIQEPICYIN